MTEIEKAAQSVLWHVEDVSADRIGSQCTLCHSYRTVLRKALRDAGVRCCSPDDTDPCVTCREVCAQVPP